MTTWALGTFDQHGSDFPGLVVGDRVRRLEFHDTLTVLQDWARQEPELDRLAEEEDSAEWIALADLRVLTPIQPRQIFQSGANYRKHVIDLVAAEFMQDADRSHGKTIEDARAFAAEMQDKRAQGGEPYVFIGLPSALCGAYDDVVLPREGAKHDYELELALVIGQGGRRIDPSEAMDHVAAYTICNDITTRDRLYRPDLKAIGTDWLRAKNAPTFLPTGPYLVPASQYPNPHDVQITLWHNGIVRQDESSADMIFDIPSLISYASSLAELFPGDLLLTGSPAGNGAHWGVFLQPGDEIESSITGLGTQRNRIVAETNVETAMGPSTGSGNESADTIASSTSSGREAERIAAAWEGQAPQSE